MQAKWWIGVGYGMVILVGTGAAWGAPPAPSPREAQRIAANRIALAPTPSAAIQAYSQGLSNDPGSIALRQAFLERMISLGMPQMAAADARDLVQRDPHDGLAWGVLAFTEAAAGDTTVGLQDIVSAARYARDDPFVGRTAGQLLAWFDTEADWRLIPPYLMHELDAVRERLRNTEPFATTYWTTRQLYEVRNDQGLPNLSTPLYPPFYPPLYAWPVPERPYDRDRYLRPPTRQPARHANREPRVARGGIAQNDLSTLPPPLPDQPFPRRGAPLPRIKQPIEPPSVPLTRSPAGAEFKLRPPS